MVKVANSAFITNLQDMSAALKNNLKLNPVKSIQDPIKIIYYGISINDLHIANSKTICNMTLNNIEIYFFGFLHISFYSLSKLISGMKWN